MALLLEGEENSHSECYFEVYSKSLMDLECGWAPCRPRMWKEHLSVKSSSKKRWIHQGFESFSSVIWKRCQNCPLHVIKVMLHFPGVQKQSRGRTVCPAHHLPLNRELLPVGAAALQSFNCVWTESQNKFPHNPWLKQCLPRAGLCVKQKRIFPFANNLKYSFKEDEAKKCTARFATFPFSCLSRALEQPLWHQHCHFVKPNPIFLQKLLDSKSFSCQVLSLDLEEFLNVQVVRTQNFQVAFLQPRTTKPTVIIKHFQCLLKKFGYL